MCERIPDQVGVYKRNNATNSGYPHPDGHVIERVRHQQTDAVTSSKPLPQRPLGIAARTFCEIGISQAFVTQNKSRCRTKIFGNFFDDSRQSAGWAPRNGCGHFKRTAPGGDRRMAHTRVRTGANELFTYVPLLFFRSTSHCGPTSKVWELQQANRVRLPASKLLGSCTNLSANRPDQFRFVVRYVVISSQDKAALRIPHPTTCSNDAPCPGAAGPFGRACHWQPVGRWLIKDRQAAPSPRPHLVQQS